VAFASSCPKDMYLVREHKRQAHYRNDGTYVSGTTVSSHCRHYRSEGPLDPKFKNEMPKGWPYKKETFKQCPKKKKEKILNILNSLPNILTQIGKLTIYCPSKSETPNNPATSAPDDKIISLYDSSFEMDTKRVITHELAHILWARLSSNEKKTYYSASQWKEDPINKVYKTNRKTFSAPDGSHDPEEDFANNIEYYLTENTKFKSNFPQINTWIKNLFGDTK